MPPGGGHGSAGPSRLPELRPDLVVVDHDLPSGAEVLGERYVLT
ncbi:MAG TPA: hypothetical protein VK908_03115 [Jiangellales bacterium]|nr:hypothetical protein [Jiangellales bacterium]